MSFATRDWLQDSVERIRDHTLYKVEISAGDDSRTFAKERVVAHLFIHRPDVERWQEIYFNQDDIDTCLPTLMKTATESTRLEITVDTLADFDDSALVKFLSSLFAKRQNKSNPPVLPLD
jgi:hypothetical protein